MQNEEREFQIFIIGSKDNKLVDSDTIRFRLRRAKDAVEEQHARELPAGHFLPFVRQSDDARYHAGRVYLNVVVIGRCENPDFFVGFISDDKITELGLRQCYYLFEVSSLVWQSDKAMFEDWLRHKPMYSSADELLISNRLLA